jgi:hypothetical protein
MLRAVGSFRRVGFPVIPYPLGYTMSGLDVDYWSLPLQTSTNLVRADVAFHKRVGLIAYWLTARPTHSFPGSNRIRIELEEQNGYARIVVPFA